MNVVQKMRTILGGAVTDWIKKGDELHRQGRFDYAISCYDKAIMKNQQLETAWINRAASLDRLGRFDEAIHCCGGFQSACPPSFSGEFCHSSCPEVSVYVHF